jgi:hypothetical protein
MSAHAYKVIEIVREPGPTFPLHEAWICNALGVYEKLGGNYGGIISVFKDDVISAFESIRDGLLDNGDPAEKSRIRGLLRRILKDIPKGENFVEYDCY